MTGLTALVLVLTVLVLLLYWLLDQVEAPPHEDHHG